MKKGFAMTLDQWIDPTVNLLLHNNVNPLEFLKTTTSSSILKFLRGAIEAGRFDLFVELEKQEIQNMLSLPIEIAQEFFQTLQLPSSVYEAKFSLATLKDTPISDVDSIFELENNKKTQGRIS